MVEYDPDIPKLGEMADELLSKELFEGALKAYQQTLDKIKASNNLNSFFLSKTCLGLMIVYIKISKSEKFAEIFCSYLDDVYANPLYAIGILSLDKALVSMRDFLIYMMLRCYFDSLRKDFSIAQKTEAINRTFSLICQDALENSNLEDVFEIAINRWKLHLIQLFGKDIPKIHLKTIDQLETQYKKPVEFSSKARFPVLDPWTPGEPKLIFKPDGSVTELER